MWNLKLVERFACLDVTLFITSHVCWQVLSPGALMSQNSVKSNSLRSASILQESKYSYTYTHLVKVFHTINAQLNKSLDSNHFIYLFARSLTKLCKSVIVNIWWCCYHVTQSYSEGPGHTKSRQKPSGYRQEPTGTGKTTWMIDWLTDVNEICWYIVQVKK